MPNMYRKEVGRKLVKGCTGSGLLLGVRTFGMYESLLICFFKMPYYPSLEN